MMFMRALSLIFLVALYGDDELTLTFHANGGIFLSSLGYLELKQGLSSLLIRKRRLIKYITKPSI
jgi:hypothetical protein